MASDAAAEDQGEFVGLTDGAIGVEDERRRAFSPRQ